MLLNIIPFVHLSLQEVIQAGDVVIDATAGNGHDTAFLARQVGTNGRVFAFDLQHEALANTHQLLCRQQLDTQVSLIHASHAEVAQYVSAGVRAAIFNCGYLPGADKKFTTTAASTLAALQSVLAIMLAGGRIGVVLYPGHEAGRIETKAVLDWAAQLSQQQVAVLRYGFINRVHQAPFALILEKLLWS
ncbi:class I SAM-dependent methyltransferase [Neisseriaceae bacterium ESL0693]|nr:class I SAM-dependent methyltransferase [Neisseriaceae bacterium ESL0693]